MKEKIKKIVVTSFTSALVLSNVFMGEVSASVKRFNDAIIPQKPKFSVCGAQRKESSSKTVGIMLFSVKPVFKDKDNFSKARFKLEALKSNGKITAISGIKTIDEDYDGFVRFSVSGCSKGDNIRYLGGGNSEKYSAKVSFMGDADM